MEVSTEAKDVLRLLRDRHNVLITGAPGTGKTRLLSEVRRAFLAQDGIIYLPENEVPIPKDGGANAEWLPSPERTSRAAWAIDFHQGTKYRDFVRGMEPKPGTAPASFHVRNGVCWLANEHALLPDGAALLVIDEINRGPAVQIFGDLIVAIEGDKRLLPDGASGEDTHYFPVIDDDGLLKEIALSHHLYILAAMNQADTSVEPLDVAFLRRFAPFRLGPNSLFLTEALGLNDYPAASLPLQPTSASDVLAAAFRAWEAVNDRIALGRGREFCLGHGIFLSGSIPDGTSTVEAGARSVRDGFDTMRAHVEEVFFGDLRAIAEVWNIGAHNPDHPWHVSERMFAGEPRIELDDVHPADASALYTLMRSIAEPTADE